jgi:hypothetical protein
MLAAGRVGDDEADLRQASVETSWRSCARPRVLTPRAQLRVMPRRSAVAWRNASKPASGLSVKLSAMSW